MVVSWRGFVRAGTWHGALLSACFLVCSCATAPSDSAKAGAAGKSPLVEDRVTASTSALLGTPPKPAEPPEAAGAETAEAEVAEAEELTQEYQVTAGDILDFRSFDDDTLNREVQVRYDGCVSLPLIPDVQIGGMTRDQAEKKLCDLYLAVFHEPRLSLTVKTAAGKVYYVLGDVTTPRDYPYLRRTTVLEAINMAGGLRPQMRGGTTGTDYTSGIGSLTKAFVIRHENGLRSIVECDMSGLTNIGPHPSGMLIHPGDVVYVPEGVNLVYVIGEVRRPSVFQLTEHMTLLRVLAYAGWAAESTAKVRNVVLLRQTGQDTTDVMLINLREALRTGADLPMEAGDIVYVPRKGMVRAEEFIGRVSGILSPVMNLYSQAWETSFTKKRLEALFSRTGNNQATTTVSILSSVRDLGTAIQPLVTPPVTTP